MKIHLDMTGKELAKPDFATLRAGLAAVQAATPTAAACDRAQAPRDLTEALMLLFADQVADVRDASALHGSFNPVSVREDNDEQTER